MSKFKGTPGPWRMVGGIRGNNLTAWIFGKDPSPGANRDVQIGKIIDAHVYKPHLERRLADFKLWSLAPEMLEAMQEFVDRVDRGEVKSKNTYTKFKSIINKATNL